MIYSVRMEGQDEKIEKAMSAYRSRMDSFVCKHPNPPTKFELDQKHAEIVSEIKSVVTGVNTAVLDSDLNRCFDTYITHNRLQRQVSLLKSALGNSLFEETQKDLRTLASIGSAGSIGSCDISE